LAELLEGRFSRGTSQLEWANCKSDEEQLQSPERFIQNSWKWKENVHVHVQEFYTTEVRSASKVKWDLTSSAGQNT